MASRMKKKLYEKEKIQLAIDAVKNGSSIYKAASQFKIPKSTIRDKLLNVYPDRNSGPARIFSVEQECLIESWILEMGKSGYPVTKQQLRESVTLYARNLGVQDKFKNRTPSAKWLMNFLKRHPNISFRVAQNLTKSRAKITLAALNMWFDTVKNYLSSSNNSDILNDPSRIFNCDESAFFLNPKEKSVLAKKGSKVVFNRIGNDEKECLTVLINANAEGTLAPPIVLYAYKRLPISITEKMPKGWGLGRTDSGWMTGEAFYEYVANVFHPWLVKSKVKLPVLFFVDGHVSHLSLNVTEFCKSNGIILVALLPNATHIIQPMDVCLFGPLKKAWLKTVHEWKINNNYSKLSREDFAPLLKTCLSLAAKPETFKNGFRSCGLYPFTVSAIDTTKLLCEPDLHGLLQQSSTAGQHYTVNKNPNAFLKEFESRIDSEKLELFYKSNNNWTGEVEDTNLFKYWLNLQNEILQTDYRNHQGEDEEHTKSLEQTADESLGELAYDVSNMTFDENWFSGGNKNNFL